MKIDRAILSRGTMSGIAREFRVSEDVISRHRGHVSQALTAVRAKVDIARAEGLAKELASLFATAQEVLAEARQGKKGKKDGRLALEAIGRLTKLLELGHRIATTPAPDAEWPMGVPKFDTSAEALAWVRDELLPQLEARAAQEAMPVDTEGGNNVV